jgi:hypothetical protein
MKLKTTIFIKCLTAWNWLSDSLYSLKSKVSNFYSHIACYFKKDTHLWYIVNGFNVPFKGNNLYNMKPEWTYDILKNRLSKEVNEGEVKDFTVSWLSTKLMVNNEERDMDNFFNTLTITTTENELPRMEVILLAWSLYKKEWYLSDNRIEFHMIDHMANDSVLVYESKNILSPFKADKTKLYIL